MARADLGTKRVCPTTGRKFYDLNRDPIVSPYTGETIARSTFEPQQSLRASARPAAREEEEEVEVVPAEGGETVSLEEVGAAEESVEAAEEEETGLVEEVSTDEDDTFLEEEEEGADDVADLIDGDIEDDEES